MFTTVRARFGNMRKETSFTLCPGSGGRVILQSEKRIAELLSPDVVLLSDGKGGHPGFHKLSRDLGAREFPVDRGLGETIIALAQQSLGPVVVALSGAAKPEEPLFYWARTKPKTETWKQCSPSRRAYVKNVEPVESRRGLQSERLQDWKSKRISLKTLTHQADMGEYRGFKQFYYWRKQW